MVVVVVVVGGRKSTVGLPGTAAAVRSGPGPGPVRSGPVRSGRHSVGERREREWWQQQRLAATTHHPPEWVKR